ncbi:DUF5691 domain-containing protein [Nocardia sp. NPDC127579]|uniref:DUF5691 domain-containing protein n=1 Tax=Nocardia sp. NPDC127579 TaxID=3345402 RepID=UPI0036328A70
MTTGAAAQREVRVTAGLGELDRWLGDQVRTGLAHSDRSDGAFAAMAARMVDAQAPGVARVLRRLPDLVAARADWPDALLREYARLHLLVTAHQRLDELPPALRASVRTHIGYPTRTASVRAEPAVRDQWMALGVRTTEDDRLHTRRIWLRGRRTGRFAVLVDHSFGAADFPKDVPAPGRMAEADLHYYPAAAPLRAVWGERYSPDEPFTTIPRVSADRHPGGETADTAPHTAGSVTGCLTEQAEALAADPWLRAWPVLLSEVVPVVGDDGWLIAESSGAALPFAADQGPWHLLGISGGHPVTVFGEWTSAGLVPISVFTAGEVIDLETESAQQADAATTVGEYLASVALLGTARRTVDIARLDPAVGAVVARSTSDPAVLLLESAALHSAFTRAGARSTSAVLPISAPDDPRRPLPAAAARRLAAMLRDRSPFLPEWFEAAAPYDFRAPDALCALLLEQAAAHAGLRALLLRLAGARGRWLAAQRAQWRELEWPSASGVAGTAWQSGKPAERVAWLAGLRDRDPALARYTLARAWPDESGAVKAELLATCSTGLSLEDEPLLESALDDRRSDVRRTAAALLARLPNSAFAQRMTARADDWLTIHPGPALHVTLPDPLDPAARRDGIFDRPVEFTYRWNGTPDPTAGRLRQLVAATPLSYWRTRLTRSNGQSGETAGPAEVLRAGVEERFRQPIFDGWVDAALAQRDSAWAKALFEAGVPSDVALLRRRELFALLPEADRVRQLLRLDGSWFSEIEALLPAMGHPWPEPVAHHLLLLLFERSRVAAQRAGAHGAGPAAHRSLLVAAAAHLPVESAGTAAVLARRCEDPGWQHAFDRLARDLTHRSMMLEELH